MITNVQPPIFSFLVATLAQPVVALSQEQATLLAGEISDDPEGRGYEGQPAEIVHMLLHGEYTKPVPERWEVKSVVTGAELKNWIAPLATALVLDPTIDPALAKKWKEVMDTWAKVSDSYVFDPSASATWGGLVAMTPELVNGAGQRVITPEIIRALTHTLVPAQVEMARPRIEQLLGTGIVLSLEDVQGVM